MNVYTRKGIREISDRYGFRRSDSLGQNFLVDLNIIEKIVDAAELDSDTLVIEIGPGMGVLTKLMLEQAGKVIAVEIDRHLIPLLHEILGEYENLEIINEDILKVDLRKIIDESSFSKTVIVGNLPYYITTPIIMGILEKEVPMDRMVVMMQKEVANRIVTSPGSKAYGALSVACQFYCEPEYVMTVPKTVFQPQPKVDSAVLRLNKRAVLPWNINNRDMFFRIVRAGFNQRRKTLLNALSAMDGVSKERLGNVFEAVDIDPKRRAETLSIDEFSSIANEITNNGE